MRAVLLEMDQSHLRVAVPLLLRGALLGFFLLGPKRSGELYTDEDRVLLKLIANQATLAYERPRLMKEITSGFVHEIKMPLSNIALPAELSYMDLEDLENGKKSLGDIVPKIKTRLKAIMSQAMLAGEKIETIRQVSDVDRLGNSFAKVSEIVEKSLFQTQDLLHKTFIGVTVDVKNPDVLIRGSAKQIEIVLINLIKNAVDAMVEGRAENRRLEIRATEEKGMVYLDVHDNGPGIPPAQIEAIFEPHFSTKGSAGSGMGLYLSRQIVKAHGGIIQVKSDSTIGTCFSIRLPKCDSEIQKVALSNQLGGK
jgi:two-component system NtrC family sensor kinase